MAFSEPSFSGPAQAKKSALKKSTAITHSSGEPSSKKTVTFAPHTTIMTIPQEGSGREWFNSKRTLVPVKNKPEDETEQVELARTRTKVIKAHRHIWECFEKWRWAGMPRDETERYMVTRIASLHANDEEWNILPHGSRVVWSCVESDYRHRQLALEKSKLRRQSPVQNESRNRESDRMSADYDPSATAEDLSQEHCGIWNPAATESDDAPKESPTSAPTTSNALDPTAGLSIPNDDDSTKQKHSRWDFDMSKAMLHINRSSLAWISAVLLVLFVVAHQLKAEARP